MRLRLLALAAVVSSLVAGAAEAQTSGLYGAFQSMCAGHQGAVAAALADADKAGWMTLNSAMVPIPASPTFKLNSYEVRLHTDASGLMMLVAGDGVTTSAATQPMPASVCMLVAKPGDPSALTRAAAWAGVPFLISQGPVQVYAFADGPAGHTVVTPATIKTAQQSGRLSIVMTGSTPQGDSSLLAFMKLKPAP